jgi:hypothetical protein
MELDFDIIEEAENQREDNAYVKTAMSIDNANLILNQTALSDLDIKLLLTQHGIKIKVIDLNKLNFKDLILKHWNLIYCNGNKKTPPHWIGCVSMGNEVYIFDSFGRHIQDIYEDHKIMPKNEEVFTEPEDFITLTENVQGPISQACGYYQCVYAAIFMPQKSPTQFNEIISRLFSEVQEAPIIAGIVSFHNDKAAVTVFGQLFTVTSEISSHKFKNQLIRVRRV